MNSEQEIVVYEKWHQPDWFDQVSEEQWAVFEKLAALNYTVEDIAVYYCIDPIEFKRYFSMIGSPLSFHYKRGQLIQKAGEGMSMLQDAKNGENAMQAVRLDKKRYEKEYKNTLEEIMFTD